MTLNIFPVVYFAVSRSLLASGQRLAIVARVHGASAWRAFWHITLPMLSPALAAGMLLAFTPPLKSTAFRRPWGRGQGWSC